MSVIEAGAFHDAADKGNQGGVLTIADAHSWLYGDARPEGEQSEDAQPEDAQLEDAQSDGECAQPEGADDDKIAFPEGTVGLGVDIVEIDRMRAILEKGEAFSRHVFSQSEREYCEGKANSATHYAMRFAAKEAVVKALGTGFSDGIWVRDIEVGRDKKGKPFAILSGRAREVAESQGVRDLSISLSYTHNEAVACALAVTESSVRESEKRRDPMVELTRQFKETRKILDEL